jgi:predicted lipoprotein with Yx(FWY)xxD motif
LAVAVLLGAPVVLAACGGSGGNVGIPTGGAPTTGAAGPGYMVRTASVAGLGHVLVDGYGLTLYLFVPDGQSGKSTCSGYCASRWPPLTLPTGVTTPDVGPGAQAALVKTTQRSDGVLQVTYDGWPLYHWIGDTAAGQDNGEGVNDAGGYWYAVDAAGQAVH